MKKIGAFQLLSAFPEKLSPLLVYQGTVTSEDVRMALYVEEGDDVEINMVLFNFLLDYVDTLSEKGTISCLLCDLIIIW